jgi:hypothetical protein
VGLRLLQQAREIHVARELAMARRFRQVDSVEPPFPSMIFLAPSTSLDVIVSKKFCTTASIANNIIHSTRCRYLSDVAISALCREPIDLAPAIHAEAGDDFVGLDRGPNWDGHPGPVWNTYAAAFVSAFSGQDDSDAPPGAHLLRLTCLRRPDAGWPHHLVVLVLDDVAVPQHGDRTGRALCDQLALPPCS